MACSADLQVSKLGVIKVNADSVFFVAAEHSSEENIMQESHLTYKTV